MDGKKQLATCNRPTRTISPQVSFFNLVYSATVLTQIICIGLWEKSRVQDSFGVFTNMGNPIQCSLTRPFFWVRYGNSFSYDFTKSSVTFRGMYKDLNGNARVRNSICVYPRPRTHTMKRVDCEKLLHTRYSLKWVCCQHLKIVKYKLRKYREILSEWAMSHQHSCT